ncbi:MAG: oligosaccharide flippase family protein [Actinobacteria bacterium]|nr:oligosaccharide flippase family protein [Actinomycetota bacterium]
MARHASLYLVARVVSGALNFAALAAYTRLLDPSAFGRYALVVAGAAIGYVTLFQWLVLSVARFRQAFLDDTESLTSAVLAGFAGVLGCSAVGLIFVLLSGTVPGDLRGLVILGACILWAQGWYELNLEFARSELEPRRYLWRSVVRSIAGVTVGITLAAAGYGATGVLLGHLLGYAAGSVPGWSRWATGFVRPPRNVLRQLLTYGLPFVATFALNYVVNGSDRLLIGALINSGQVGLYAAGYDIANNALGVVMSVVNLAGYPLVVRAFERGGSELAEPVIERNVVSLLALALPAATGLAVLAPDIAAVFLGERFQAAAAQVIPWVAFGGFFLWMKAFYADLPFHLRRATVQQAGVSLVAATTNVALNLWWIPTLGMLGAAYATFVSYVVAFVTSLLVGRRLYALAFPVGAAARIVAASGLMALAVVILPVEGALGLAVRVVIGAALYLVLIAALDVYGLRRWLVAGIQRQDATRS